MERERTTWNKKQSGFLIVKILNGLEVLQIGSGTPTLGDVFTFELEDKTRDSSRFSDDGVV
jgi:hypothetical protein